MIHFIKTNRVSCNLNGCLGWGYEGCAKIFRGII